MYAWYWLMTFDWMSLFRLSWNSGKWRCQCFIYTSINKFHTSAVKSAIIYFLKYLLCCVRHRYSNRWILFEAYCCISMGLGYSAIWWISIIYWNHPDSVLLSNSRIISNGLIIRGQYCTCIYIQNTVLGYYLLFSRCIQSISLNS